jgi:methylphosphotriester-DNA--protein-cysteine methyltransferase
MDLDIGVLKEFIRTRISEVRTLKEIATELNMSSETIRKEFRRKEGAPISDFIACQRVKIMKELLLTTDLCSNEICATMGIREDCGERSFKKIVGLSMQSYRDQHTRSQNKIRKMKNHSNTQRRIGSFVP